MEPEPSIYEKSMIGKAFLSVVMKCENEAEIDQLLANTFGEDEENINIGECILNIYHFCYFTGCVEREFHTINKDEPCKYCGHVLSEKTYSEYVSNLDELRVLRDSVGTLYVLSELESIKDLTCSPGEFFKECNTIIYREWRKNTEEECYKIFNCPCKNIVLK
jgi:hypothetical protein